MVNLGPRVLIDVIVAKRNSDRCDTMLSAFAANHAPIGPRHSDWTFLDAAERELTPEKSA